MPLLDDAWSAVDKETKGISTETNHLSRVSRVAGKYAGMFLADHDLYWPGAAAFASNEVRRTMLKPLARWFGLASKLSHGNIAVFDDVYPALACYHRVRTAITLKRLSIDDLIRSMKERKSPPVATEIRNAIKQIYDGERDEGARLILHYEQSQTLQRELYDKWFMRLPININYFLRNLLLPIRLRFCHSCEEINPSRVEEAKPEDGPISQFDKRWPFAFRVLKKFISLALDDNHKRFIVCQLTSIRG